MEEVGDCHNPLEGQPISENRKNDLQEEEAIMEGVEGEDGPLKVIPLPMCWNLQPMWLLLAEEGGEGEFKETLAAFPRISSSYLRGEEGEIGIIWP